MILDANRFANQDIINNIYRVNVAKMLKPELIAYQNWNACRNILRNSRK